MNHEVDAAPPVLQGIEGAVHGRDVLDVAGEQDIGPDRCGERLHTPAESFTLICEGEFRPVLVQLLGDAPGDRVVVRDTHDESAAARHQ